MRLTYNWLKDFVDIKIPAQKLAEKLTMAGLEVTSLEGKDGDYVFEIEVTSNRPDCLSVIGIAREVAVITNRKLSAIRYPLSANKKRYPLNAKTLKIDIGDKNDCPLYTAKIIKDVKVGPSPGWLKKRLELIGCRSINNIVDITNCILFTYGEPLHAFDLDKIVSQLASYPVGLLEIVVRRAIQGEEIITIDGIKRVLNGDMLIITAGTGRQADRQTGKPIAIAGIMGSKDTEVTLSTRNILLEAAVFDPITVRLARQKLGLQSESAYRFERGVAGDMVEFSSSQAVKLIQEFSGGRVCSAKSSGLGKTRRKNIKLDTVNVQKILGVNITAVQIKKALNNLGFKIKGKDNFVANPPFYRPDVDSEIDLIEEIARVFGYNAIPKSLPALKPQISGQAIGDSVALVKNILLGLGLNEVITYSLLDRGLFKAFGIEDSNLLAIANPLSKELEVLRPTLIPSLCRAVAYNLNQKQDYIAIFEIAKAFSVSGEPAPKEELVLGIALCGTKSLLLEQGLIKDSLGLLHLKGILEVLFERLGIKDYSFNSVDNGRTISVYANKEEVGFMARLAPSLLASAEIKNKEVFALELSMEKLLCYVNLNKKFKPLPAYPGISRDISLVLKEGISAAEILQAIRQEATALLKGARVTDYYKGRQIPPGFRGLTISCFYCADERTLTETEINPVHSSICEALKDGFSANIRS